MNQPCPRCGAELPAIANFCPICGEKLEARALAAADQATDQAAAAAQPAREQEERPDAPPPSPPAPPGWRVPPVSGIEMLGPAAMAGIAGGFLVGVPGLGACGCLWMLACGGLAVFFFQKQFGRAPLANEAAKLGLLSGLFGFLVGVVVSFASFALIRRNVLGLVEALRENMEQSAKMVRPQDADQMIRMMNSPGGAAMLLFSFAAVYFVGFLAFGTLGALLAGALARRRD